MIDNNKQAVTVTAKVGFWHAVATIVQSLAWLGVIAVWCQSCTSCRPIWPTECQHAPVEPEGGAR